MAPSPRGEARDHHGTRTRHPDLWRHSGFLGTVNSILWFIFSLSISGPHPDSLCSLTEYHSKYFLN